MASEGSGGYQQQPAPVFTDVVVGPVGEPAPKDAFSSDVSPPASSFQGFTNPVQMGDFDAIPVQNTPFWHVFKLTLTNYVGIGFAKQVYAVLFIVGIVAMILSAILFIVISWYVGLAAFICAWFGLPFPIDSSATWNAPIPRRIFVPIVTIISIFVYIFNLRLVVELIMSVFHIRRTLQELADKQV